MRAELALPGRPDDASAARGFVRNTCALWQLPEELCDDVALSVSELVTNALLHGRGARAVSLELERGRLRLAVVDASPSGVPRTRVYADTSAVGRGLQLVAALSQAWGWEPTADGKSVWCDFAATA